VGTPQDLRLAAEWYHKAAEQGDAKAQNNLGVMYEFGYGVPVDPQEAVVWYRKAAEQGNIKSHINLGNIYAKGKDVPIDYVLAYMFYTLGAKASDGEDRQNRENVKRMLSPRGIEKAQALARNWKVGTPLPTQSMTGQR
jgi:TPR repeat protein